MSEMPMLTRGGERGDAVVVLILRRNRGSQMSTGPSSVTNITSKLRATVEKFVLVSSAIDLVVGDGGVNTQDGFSIEVKHLLSGSLGVKFGIRLFQ